MTYQYCNIHGQYQAGWPNAQCPACYPQYKQQQQFVDCNAPEYSPPHEILRHKELISYLKKIISLLEKNNGEVMTKERDGLKLLAESYKAKLLEILNLKSSDNVEIVAAHLAYVADVRDIARKALEKK